MMVFAGQKRDFSAWAWPAIAIVAMVWFLVYRWETSRRVVTLSYDGMDSRDRQRFSTVDTVVRSLGNAQYIWAVDGSTRVSGVVSLKGNAGAAEVISRSRASVTDQEPPWVQSDISPPNLRSKGWHASFLPDGLLVVAGKIAAFTPYARLSVHGKPIRFIESESTPGDANVVGQTWQYVNKGGGPDRRYSNNRQLPICEYGEIELRSPDLAVTFQVSHLQTAQCFVRDFVQVLSQARQTP
jgi:hypothetical protein